DFAVDTAPPAYYTRWGNPTVRELEEALADLEGGARALATGSGMGAIASAILTSVDRGNHVVAGSSLYTATTEIFTRLLPRFGIETTFVDPRRRGAWKESVRPDTRSVRGVPRPPGTQNAPPPDGGSVEDRAIARRVPGGPSRGPRGPLSGTAVVSPTRSGEEADGRFWGNALLRTERRLSGREAVRGIRGRRHPRREP